MDNESNLFTVAYIGMKENTKCYRRLREEKEKGDRFSGLKKIQAKNL